MLLLLPLPLLSRLSLARYERGIELLYQCLPNRFRFAGQWAGPTLTRLPTVSAAYILHQRQSGLVDGSVVDARHPTFSPTLQLQHTPLSPRMSSLNAYFLPLDYIPYQVDLEDAIETLEKGGALLWSEKHYLHASID
jgi:hypothetical protein